ncbi:hypothetical protein [Actinophytocola sp.]|uniref:hypothetical protein n=1 Tax=Actinophytocola sp. TaxID=1872138 RepID=UPI002EDAE6AC
MRHAAARTRLTTGVPWLNLLDPAVLADLDLDELVVPAGAVAAARTDLEAALGAYVMTYRPTRPAPGKRQLCQVLAPAELDPASVAALRDAEQRLPGVLLCAYARPLRYRL